MYRRGLLKPWADPVSLLSPEVSFHLDRLRRGDTSSAPFALLPVFLVWQELGLVDHFSFNS